MSDVWRALLVIALVLGNAIFVAAEYALVTARRTRLEERAESGRRSARTALKLMDEPVRSASPSVWWASRSCRSTSTSSHAASRS